MLADSGECPALAKDGAPRGARRCLGRSIPVVLVHLAGVGMLLAFHCTLGCFASAPGVNMAEGDTLISVDYEVFGKVQGVFFRKYTQHARTNAISVSLLCSVGWCLTGYFQPQRLRVKSWDW